MRTHYDAYMDCALLGLAAWPESQDRAVMESGCGSWEEFCLALDLACIRGFAAQTAAGAYSLTSAGREHGMALLAAERDADAGGELTCREASACHADVAHQHTYPHDHPLLAKLYAMMVGDEHEPLTASEADSVAAHLQLQTGPARDPIVAKLHAYASQLRSTDS